MKIFCSLLCILMLSIGCSSGGDDDNTGGGGDNNDIERALYWELSANLGGNTLDPTVLVETVYDGTTSSQTLSTESPLDIITNDYGVADDQFEFSLRPLSTGTEMTNIHLLIKDAGTDATLYDKDLKNVVYGSTATALQCGRLKLKYDVDADHFTIEYNYQ